MKIKIITIVILSMLVLSGFFGIFIFENESVKATTYYVGGSGVGNHTTIQSAIDKASYGDTVFVYSGTYFEHIHINKTLNLIGEDRSNTTVDGKGTKDVIQVNANRVLIKGFTVKNCGNARLDGGIKVYNANNCSIIGNNASSNGFSGIILLTATNNIIRDNIISFNSGSGLMLRYTSTSNIAINNSIHDNYLNKSITWYDTAGLVIVYACNNNLFSGNTIINNYKNGIKLYHSDNNIIKFNRIIGHENGTNFESINKGQIFYLNDFINNSKHVLGESSLRTWNSPIKIVYLYNNTNFTNYLGNYWDDYTGYDNNSDGIGDSPYYIGIGTEKDLYPLMKPTSYYQIIPSSTKVNMVETYSNSTNKTVSIMTQNATLNVSITGDFNGSINFTDLELVIITSGSFAGSGFFKGNWKATIEGKYYYGTWRGMLFNKTGERKYYLKGTVFGGLWGITDGYLIESSLGSGTYDMFNSTSTIYKLGSDITFAQLTLNGTMSYQKSLKTSAEIYILQALFKGNATGYYNKSLSVVLTHIRINTKSHQYYGFGFSTISYVSAWGSGLGWTYDRTISPNLVNLTGFFTKPLWGIVFGILNETGIKRTLSITILRVDLGSKPAPSVKVDVWGPRLASPGQKIYYFIEYNNFGLKNAYNTEIVLVLSTNVTYLNNTHSGAYNNITHTVTWKLNISAKSKNLLNTKCKIKWGLTLGTNVNCTAYIRDYIKNVTLASSTWSIFLTLAIDPNMKSGPEGNVTPGQRLNYKIEYENIGSGIAYGVYFTDTLSKYLDASTLKIGPVVSSQDGSIITTTGIYDPAVRTLTWFAGEVGSGCGGHAEFSVKVRADVAPGSAILNYGTVYFPSVPEVTKTNGIVSIVRINELPVAFAGSDLVVNTYEEIIFNGTGSFDPDGTIINYTWNFGDGGVGYGGLVPHTYIDDGNYSVSLTVFDNLDFSDTHKILVQVLNRPPIAKSKVDSKNVKTKEVFINATGSSDLDGIVTDYYFELGDGSNSGWVQTPVISHKYADRMKIYCVKLKVRDDDGAISTNGAELNITINNVPIPELTVNSKEAFTYSDIICSGELSTDSDGQIGTYYFDFGDGNNSGWVTTSSVSHQYMDGTKKYIITLNVKDNYDAMSNGISSAEILIKNRKPVPSLIIEDSDIYVSDEVIFNASGSYDLDGVELEYYFDFDDGTDSGWITDPVVKHKYTKGPQEYFVELRVKDSDSEINSTVLSIMVKNRVPHVDAGPDQDVFVNQSVYFDGSGSYDPEGNVLAFVWSFGGETSTSGLNLDKTTHSYNHPGNYTVTLTVSDGTFTAKDTCIVHVTDIEPTIDTDGDGVLDELDAFPNDPAASVDSDGDNYPDYWNVGMGPEDSTTGLELDEFPNDPNRHKDVKSSDGASENIYLMVIIIIFIIILIIGILTSIIINNKNKNKRIPKPFDSDDYIRQLRDKTIQGDKTEANELSGAELLEIIEAKYQKGELSEEIYRSIEEEELS